MPWDPFHASGCTCPGSGLHCQGPSCARCWADEPCSSCGGTLGKSGQTSLLPTGLAPQPAADRQCPGVGCSFRARKLRVLGLGVGERLAPAPSGWPRVQQPCQARQDGLHGGLKALWAVLPSPFPSVPAWAWEGEAGPAWGGHEEGETGQAERAKNPSEGEESRV